jgi:predicted acylesterase/phospholipase RssA
MHRRRPIRHYMDDNGPFRALALDGGGFRGLYTATLLEELGRFFAGDTAADLGRRFDLITGTSTGGILACGLAVGVSPRRIIELYEKEGPKIFANPLPVQLFGKLGWVLRNAFKAANRAAPLRNGLVEIFGDKTLGKSTPIAALRCAFPASGWWTRNRKFSKPHTTNVSSSTGTTLWLMSASRRARLLFSFQFIQSKMQAITINVSHLRMVVCGRTTQLSWR